MNFLMRRVFKFTVGVKTNLLGQLYYHLMHISFEKHFNLLQIDEQYWSSQPIKIDRMPTNAQTQHIILKTHLIESPSIFRFFDEWNLIVILNNLFLMGPTRKPTKVTATCQSKRFWWFQKWPVFSRHCYAFQISI